MKERPPSTGRPVTDILQRVHRCQSAAAAGDPNGDKTMAASQNLQELCAVGLGRSTAELIKSRQSQGFPAGPWK